MNTLAYQCEKKIISGGIVCIMLPVPILPMIGLDFGHRFDGIKDISLHGQMLFGVSLYPWPFILICIIFNVCLIFVCQPCKIVIKSMKINHTCGRLFEKFLSSIPNPTQAFNIQGT